MTRKVRERRFRIPGLRAVGKGYDQKGGRAALLMFHLWSRLNTAGRDHNEMIDDRMVRGPGLELW